MKYLNQRKLEDRVAFAYQYLNTAVRNQLTLASHQN